MDQKRREGFVHSCDDSCRSARCPAAIERIKAGWRNGRDIAPGVKCLRLSILDSCTFPGCNCTEKQTEMTQQIIDRFDGEYYFLSNFFPSLITYNGSRYKTVEHAYQAAKTVTAENHHAVMNAETPGESKKLARSFSLRSGWDEMKLSIMKELLTLKFAIPELKVKLLRTGSAELIEGNTWGDVYYGVCRGVGENHLGKSLMELRTALALTERGNNEP